LAVGFLAFLFLVALAADTGRIPHVVRKLCEFPGGDKVGHFGLYGVMGFLGAMAWPRPIRTGWPLARGFLPATILACVEELTQIWTPGRSAEWFDLGAGLLGIAVAAGAARLLRRQEA
jgi:VanZ family protein